ncbi:hypothetical protein GCM10017784_28020 [Deinococcus indicus]|nr:hypothetical protein GCM10017784_28020 [Deinococcus indicus]
MHQAAVNRDVFGANASHEEIRSLYSTPEQMSPKQWPNDTSTELRVVWIDHKSIGFDHDSVVGNPPLEDIPEGESTGQCA